MTNTLKKKNKGGARIGIKLGVSIGVEPIKKPNRKAQAQFECP